MENAYWKAVQLSKKADLLVLNTTNYHMFVNRLNVLVERKGRVLVETSEMDTIQKLLGKNYNVLYKSDRVLLFSY